MEDVFGKIFAWLHSLNQSARGTLDVVQSLDPALRIYAAGFGALLKMFVLTGLFVPGDTLVLVAASSVSSPCEGIALGTAVTIGALLGEILGYGLGRWIGTTTRGTRLLRRTGAARISSAQRFLRARGGPAILAARFVPGLRTVMPFVVGPSGFSFRRFLTWSVPASIAWSGIYITVYSLLAAPLRGGHGSLLLSAALAMMGFAVFATAFLVQFLVERAHRREGELVGAVTEES